MKDVKMENLSVSYNCDRSLEVSICFYGKKVFQTNTYTDLGGFI